MSEIEGKEQRSARDTKARSNAINDAVPDKEPPTAINEMGAGSKRNDMPPGQDADESG